MTGPERGTFPTAQELLGKSQVFYPTEGKFYPASKALIPFESSWDHELKELHDGDPIGVADGANNELIYISGLEVCRGVVAFAPTAQLAVGLHSSTFGRGELENLIEMIPPMLRQEVRLLSVGESAMSYSPEGERIDEESVKKLTLDKNQLIEISEKYGVQAQNIIFRDQRTFDGYGKLVGMEILVNPQNPATAFVFGALPESGEEILLETIALS